MRAPSWLKEHHGLELRVAQGLMSVAHNPLVNEDHDEVEQEQPLQNVHVAPDNHARDDREHGGDQPDVIPVSSKKSHDTSRK